MNVRPRRSDRLLCAYALVALSLSPATAPGQNPPGPPPPASRGYEDHQVPAGLAISIELRTAVSSNTSEKGQEVRGRLLRPIVAGGEEVVPAGAHVLGTVSDVEPAGLRLRGRLSLAFHVIEHPETGSRATIRGGAVSWESPRPTKGKVYPEIRLERGAEVTFTLRAPLVVRIPIVTPPSASR